MALLFQGGMGIDPNQDNVGTRAPKMGHLPSEHSQRAQNRVRDRS